MIVLAPLLFLLFVAALAVHTPVVAAVAVFVTGVYGTLRLWMRHAVAGLTVSRQFSDRAFVGDEVEVDLCLRSQSLLPIPWLVVGESIPLDLGGPTFGPQVLSLGAQEERHMRYTLRCERRGYHPLGPLHVRTGDVLGVAEGSLAFREERRITVYPRVVPLERLGLPTRSAQVAIPTTVSLFEDPSRVAGIRDYRQGDLPRRIHWSATAHTGRLVVKQLEPATARETMICLDLDRRDYAFAGYDASELAIVVAASLAHHIGVREGQPVGLTAEGRESGGDDARRITLRPRSGREQTMRILEALAHIQPTVRGNFAALLREESPNLTWGTTLLVITGRLRPALAETLLALKQRGHAVAAVAVRPTTSGGAEDVYAPGIPVHQVWSEKELAVLR